MLSFVKKKLICIKQKGILPHQSRKFASYYRHLILQIKPTKIKILSWQKKHPRLLCTKRSKIHAKLSTKYCPDAVESVTLSDRTKKSNNLLGLSKFAEKETEPFHQNNIFRMVWELVWNVLSRCTYQVKSKSRHYFLETVWRYHILVKERRFVLKDTDFSKRISF